jgi:hypothetical protein
MMNGELQALVATSCPKRAFGSADIKVPFTFRTGSAGEGTLDIHRARAGTRTPCPGCLALPTFPDARQQILSRTISSMRRLTDQFRDCYAKSLPGPLF